MQSTADIQNSSLEQLKQKYIDTMSPKEKQAYLIAVSHLGMSFQLEKSRGFLHHCALEMRNQQHLPLGAF